MEMGLSPSCLAPSFSQSSTGTGGSGYRCTVFFSTLITLCIPKFYSATAIPKLIRAQRSVLWIFLNHMDFKYIKHILTICCFPDIGA